MIHKSYIRKRFMKKYLVLHKNRIITTKTFMKTLTLKCNDYKCISLIHLATCLATKNTYIYHFRSPENTVVALYFSHPTPLSLQIHNPKVI